MPAQFNHALTTSAILRLKIDSSDPDARRDIFVLTTSAILRLKIDLLTQVDDADDDEVC